MPGAAFDETFRCFHDQSVGQRKRGGGGGELKTAGRQRRPPGGGSVSMAGMEPGPNGSHLRRTDREDRSPKRFFWGARRLEFP